MSSVRLFRTFLAVAQEGSFAAAAPRVAMTPAAVGQQMRTLETDMRRALFERQGKAVELNDAGRALLPQARQWLALYDQMQSTPAIGGPMSGTLNLGAVVSAVRPLIEATLTLKSRHPGLEAHVSAHKSLELLSQVASGALDAAISVRERGAGPPALSWTALYAEPMVLVAGRHMTEALPRKLLQTQAFIRFDRSQHTGQMVERTLRKLRVTPLEVLELNTIESIVELVRSGLGVAVLPRLRDGRWALDPRLRVLELPQAEARQIALVQRRESVNAPAIAALVREILAPLHCAS